MANGGPYLQKMLRFHWSFSFFRGLVRYTWTFYLFVVAVKKFSLVSNSTFLYLALWWDSLNISSLSSDSLLSSTVSVCWREIPRLEKEWTHSFLFCFLCACCLLLPSFLSVRITCFFIPTAPVHAHAFFPCQILKHGILSETPTCSWDPLLQVRGTHISQAAPAYQRSEFWLRGPLCRISRLNGTFLFPMFLQT